MRTKSVFLPLIISALILTGCTTLKRYNSMMPSAVDNTLAGVDLFGFRLSQPKPAESDKTLWDLSADAQAQLVKALDARYPDNEKFRAAMNFKYLGEDLVLPSDYVTKDLRLIFSISRNHDYSKDSFPAGVQLSAADRLEYLKITLEVPGSSPVRFTGWNMYSTEYGSIDVADVSFSKTLDLDASGKLTTGDEKKGAEAGGGVKASFSRKEDQILKYRFLKLNGRLNSKMIEMEEEGTRETDLTGNILADVSLEFDRFPEVLSVISGMKDSSGKYNGTEKLKVKFNDVIVPRTREIKDTLYANLTLDYIYRNVVGRKRTFPEWDDRVRYYTGTVRKTVPLFTVRDYVPDFYCIGKYIPEKAKENLIIKGADTSSRGLIFRTYTEAVEFREWLMNFPCSEGAEDKPVKIGVNTLVFGGNDLTVRIIKKESGFRVLPCYY